MQIILNMPSFFALPFLTSSGYYSFLESDVLVPSSGIPARTEKAPLLKSSSRHSSEKPVNKGLNHSDGLEGLNPRLCLSPLDIKRKVTSGAKAKHQGVAFWSLFRFICLFVC